MRESLKIRQALEGAVNDMKRHAPKGGAEYDAAKALKAELEGELTRTLEVEAASAARAQPLGGGTPGAMPEGDNFSDQVEGFLPSRAMRRSWNTEDYLGNVRHALQRANGFNPSDTSKYFRSFGEQLQAIYNFYMTRGSTQDARLVRAPSGASEVDPTGGGFLVQLDFATSVFMRAYDMGEILGECEKITIGANSNGIKIPAIDETSRATGSRWGGVQSYWVGEGVQPTVTKPKFRHIDLSLNKLFSLFYMTDELLQDASALGQIATKAFSEETMFMTEDAIIEGTGAGQPLGVLKSPALISVAKQNGQAAATVVYENVLNMWSRMWSRSRKNAKWYLNQDVEPQLFALNQVIGVGGVPVYLPPGGLRDAPYATLLGRPVVPTEYNATLGTLGDIMLADFSQYVLADKNGMQAAQSAHVAFLTDEMVFRLTYRVDGEPIWNAPLTPFKGSNTKSPFIALAAR